MRDYRLAENEIKKVLESFQRGYTNRDISSVDDYMKKLFGDGEDLVILGTSAGEWCLTYEQCKDIFLSDWQYWGDLRLNIDEAKINVNENTAWVFTEGTLSYTFKTDEDSYKRYVDYVKGFFDEASHYNNQPYSYRLTDINLVLSYFLTPRDSIERKYLWPIRVSFIIIQNEESFVIKQIQFSLPNAYEFADLRIVKDNYAEEAYLEENKLLKGYIGKRLGEKEEVLELLRGFSEDYVKEELSIKDFMNKYFTEENPVLIATDSNFNFSREDIAEQIMAHRRDWKSINLNCENPIIHGNGNTLWLLTNGTIKRVMIEAEVFNKTAEYVKAQFNKNIPDKDKLFNIRRSISSAVKEAARGEELLYPFRFEAVFVREQETWKIRSAQFSYPFEYILEGKYNEA